MRTAEIVKIGVAVGILAVIGFTFFRGQGWWWKLTKPTRIALSLIAAAGIIAAGFMYRNQ